MTTTRIATAALALVLAAGLAAPGHAGETRGSAQPEMLKSPRKKEPPEARGPAAPDGPATKPDNPKIVYF